MKYIKSCLNYTGGKYRLLNQLLPLFPKRIDTFVDVFCGGANVALNVDSNRTICNDSNKPLIYLFNFIKNNDLECLFDSIFSIIETYGLSKSDKYGYNYYNCDSSKGLGKYNKPKYMKLRDDFNSNETLDYDKCLYFYTLIVYGFNNQIRFNKKNEFNNTVGKRDFNSRTQENLRNFHEVINTKDILFSNKDFNEFDVSDLTSKDFLYADPPYLITTASYNEQNAWTLEDERSLLKFLDNLNENNVNFALSNVLESKGKENKLLKKWANNYNVNYLNFDYSNSNYQTKKGKSVEVLICNY
ncbi:DNA adenine methylase [uncultured Methanobrevibacter sp.]|uniref:DNA adenine methylase n=1 Tax=uncultured Methanobrevibacter sp. TaxID=253161 RepID=UPI00262FC3A8|nr:DNA adenine methylase [uncultured Methanobrevibacter sp.]